MSDSSARRPRPAGRGLLLAGAVAALLLVGCSGQDDPQDTASPEPRPSTLAEVDTDVEVPRLDFCALVPADAVTDALAGDPQDVVERSPGDAARVGTASDAPEEPLREVGCTWTAGAVSARAWVFAQPVGDDAAARLVAAAGTQRGCRTEPAGTQAAYGDPGVRQRCETPDGPRLRYAGRFGDTWLTCELQGAGVGPRAEQWCVDVLTSLDPGA